MSEKPCVKVRSLPKGEWHDAAAAELSAQVLALGVGSSGAAELKPGSPVEIRSDACLYLGTLQEVDAGQCRVLLEHSVEWSKVDWVREIWG